jgi:uncharacterized protein (DUF2147 family)
MLAFPNRLYGIAQFCFVARCSLLPNGSGHFRSKVFELMSLALAFRTPDFRLMPARSTIGALIAGLFMTSLALLLGSPAARAQAGGEVSGIWLTQAGDAKVRVTKCGGGICGVVIWLKTPIDPATGQAQADDKNPNPSLRRRPIIGLPLFSGMRPDGDNKWSGQIYNADDGNSYVSHISVAGPDSLRVEGCVGMLCGGETWSRSAK